MSNIFFYIQLKASPPLINFSEPSISQGLRFCIFLDSPAASVFVLLKVLLDFGLLVLVLGPILHEFQNMESIGSDFHSHV